jgi:hypothetical protein
MGFTQPLCDDCWDKKYPERPSPRKGQGDVEQCCMCGKMTLSGIYFRIDPKTVPYPQDI